MNPLSYLKSLFHRSSAAPQEPPATSLEVTTQERQPAIPCENDLFLRDNEEYRRTTMRIENVGFQIFEHDMGPFVEQCWGDFDLERWTTVPFAEWASLIQALRSQVNSDQMGNVGGSAEQSVTIDQQGELLKTLTKAVFGGKYDALTQFNNFCDAHGIHRESDMWV